MSPDLSSAKIYLSVFPFKNLQNVFDLVLDKKKEIRNALALLVKNQVRRIPELFFYNDDSLEHIDSIDLALKKTEDPIKDRSLLGQKEKALKMNVSSFISLKYFFSKSKLHVVNIISSIAVFVLIIATCSFFVVLSVFSGLKDFGIQYNKIV